MIGFTSMHICPDCGRGYTILKQLEKHIEDFHPCKHKEDGMSSCSICDADITWDKLENNRMGYDDFRGLKKK